MKQVIIYVALSVFAAALVMIIQLNKEPVADKAITVSQYYSVMDDFQGIDVPVYLTNDDHLLTHGDAYQSIYLMNANESKKLQVTLTDITIDGEEVYLSESYTRYMLELDLPALSDDYYMTDCFLDITLLNDLHYTFSIGLFSYKHVSETVDYMFWTGIEAAKSPDVEIARIKEIAISFDTLDATINSIDIGYQQDIVFDVNDSILTISIADDYMLLYGCPIAIHYNNDETQVIGYFNYLREHAILVSSGLLNHVYDVSNAS